MAAVGGSLGPEEDDLYTFDSNRAPLRRTFRPETSSTNSTYRQNVPMSRAQNTRTQPEQRPITANRAAGYSSAPKKNQENFYQNNQNNQNRGPPPPLAKKADNSPEEACREIEKEVNQLIEESSLSASKGDTQYALERAKEAMKREKVLCKQREANGLADQIDADLSYAVLFNLAVQYQTCGMYTEAINTYTSMIKSKQYAQSGRLRINMGNIHFEQGEYAAAIKMYRMALDQTPNTGRELRARMFRNIGNSFVKLGQFSDAIGAFERGMELSPDLQTGFNLILCYYALGDRERQRRGFTRLLSVRQLADDAEEMEMVNAGSNTSDGVAEDTDARDELRKRVQASSKLISSAAKLLVTSIDSNVEAAHDWLSDALRSAGQTELAAQISIAKALYFMRARQYERATEALKSYERKDSTLVAHAATNLSFIYFHEGDIPSAVNYADIAIRANRYSAKAIVNKGNCLFVKGSIEHARHLYSEAVGAEADCLEAVYNLGMAHKRLNDIPTALAVFEKLHAIEPNSVEVIWQLADLHDAAGDSRTAIKWFKILNARVPTDAGVLARLGSIYLREDDEAQAYHYHLESYRYYPCDMNVLSWLGAYFVKSEMYEKAVSFFERAALIEPSEAKWRLMVASCYRRTGDYSRAYEVYAAVHTEHPDNVECLRYLVQICDDLGKKDRMHEFIEKLRRAERDAVLADDVAPRMSEQPSDAAIGRPPPPSNSAEGDVRAADAKERLDHYEQTQAAAAGIQKNRRITNKVAAARGDDDHFDDVDLDDANLLPQ